MGIVCPSIKGRGPSLPKSCCTITCLACANPAFSDHYPGVWSIRSPYDHAQAAIVIANSGEGWAIVINMHWAVISHVAVDNRAEANS